MATLADRTIEANRRSQDELAGRVRTLSDEDLSRPSGAAEWSVAQVLSHLGSSAEIGLGTLRAALADQEPPTDANQPVWDRWNALPPRQKAEAFLQSTEELVTAYEALDANQRAGLTIPLPFLPEPADVALLAGMRLNEGALHGWDVAVAFDKEARIPADVAGVLLEQYRGPLAFLLGFTGKVDELGRTARLRVETTAPEATFGLLLRERAVLADSPETSDGTLRIPAETLLRLFGGRLRPEQVPAGVEVHGDVSLDELRQVFPGY
jgi:uncharacterized protein (TIGR03083 family)